MYRVPEFHSSGYLVLSAPADFDLEAATEMIDDVERLAIWSSYLIIDLSRVVSIAPTAVHVLAWARRRLQALGGGLVLTGASPTTALIVADAGSAFTTYPVPDDVPQRPDRSDPVSMSDLSVGTSELLDREGTDAATTAEGLAQ